jgi:hypothetical protein
MKHRNHFNEELRVEPRQKSEKKRREMHLADEVGHQALRGKGQAPLVTTVVELLQKVREGGTEAPVRGDDEALGGVQRGSRPP